MKLFDYKKLLVLLTLVSLAAFFNACDSKTKDEKNDKVVKKDSIEAVRGVWLTNVASEALYSRENIVEAVELCDELGFNSIFVVTWNKAMTTYPSQLMEGVTGIKIDPVLGNRDPLQELIEEAHKRNIKVFAWFEFGFSCSYEEPDGGILLKAKPNWASKDKDGNLTSKNNFQWLNAFMPEVQDFIISLVLEVVNNYDVDGIQGDDRLPALPSNGGYDEFTVEMYKDEHNGKEPPEDYRDSLWTDWRAKKLNIFGKRLYDAVKAAKPNCIVSMAPSIFPWSKEEYLQDWPTWLNDGYCDLLCPQLYRKDIDAYQLLIDEIIDGKQISKENMAKFYPGILLQVDNYNPEKEFLSKMIDANRKAGVNGEVYFFYEGIKKYKDFFKKKYTRKAVFPKLLK